MKTTRFYKWILLCTIALFGSKAIAQTSFTVTNKALGSSGSLDVILASAVTSANAGNNVTVYFNVTADGSGNAFCLLSQQLPQTILTAGSIVFDKHPSATSDQGVQWDPYVVQFQPNFNVKCTASGSGNYVKIKNIHIGKLFSPSAFTSSNIQYYHLKDDVNQSYAYIDIAELAFKFEENYFDVTGVLSYKITNLNTDIITYGTAPKPNQTNWIKLSLGASPGLNLSAGDMYLLEVTDVEGNKKYLKFKYQS